MSNEQVHPILAKVLNEFAPVASVANPQLTAFDDASLKLIEQAASLLCDTDAQRKMLQMVYDIGRRDGQIEQLNESLRKLGA